SADEKHILHAWEIAPNGCTIISLCNNNTAHYPRNSKQREIAELIRTYGRSESFGECFSDAERNTGINIAQQKFNLNGGEVPDAKGVELIKKYIVELEANLEKTVWLEEIFKRYNLKQYKL
ncbi:MAG: hypothetical protein LBS43_09145, partial [Prevotellaceae bacterium]|nr:hypothetical protein [Prevotellaceae bacterium]